MTEVTLAKLHEIEITTDIDWVIRHNMLAWCRQQLLEGTWERDGHYVAPMRDYAIAWTYKFEHGTDLVAFRLIFGI